MTLISLALAVFLDVNNIMTSGDANFELTEDLLLQKLRSLESTGPKSILNGSRFSGTF